MGGGGNIQFCVTGNSITYTAPEERFDGLAVNNEAYDRSWSDLQAIQYLDYLRDLHIEASAYGLRTHYSIGWHWGREGTPSSTEERIITWNGLSANVTEHMVRIFDSVDIQVRFQIKSFLSDHSSLPRLTEYD